MPAGSTPWPIPPSRQYRGFLDPAERAGLLGWALANRERFKPAKLTGGVYNPQRRVAVKLSDLGPHREVLERRLAGQAGIFDDLGMPPFAPDLVELELAAHGDGAFFKAHSDVPLGPGRIPTGGDGTGRHDRLLSAVYYFHREPKGFSGGALRLYRIGDDKGQGEFREHAPEQNSLVVFPSWTSHEVRTVSCPSGRFEDCRFAVNIWLCREIAR